MPHPHATILGEESYTLKHPPPSSTIFGGDTSPLKHPPPPPNILGGYTCTLKNSPPPPTILGEDTCTLKDPPPPSTILGGESYMLKYEKCQELGRGKYGVVYQVKDRVNGKCYAAKHMRKQEHKEKVLEEIELLRAIANPHIIRFIDAYENLGELILVTEYLDGGELFEKVATDDFNLTESDCCLFMRQITRGVEYLHNNSVVHLDLKPENVVCVRKDCTNIKIIDFGTAKTLIPGEKVRVMCGTPEFIAPEVVSYDVIGQGTDMWSVGVICYILLSGFSPFMGETDADTYNNIAKVTYDFDEPEFDLISSNAKDFICHLLMKQPRRRMTAKMCLDHPWLLEKEIGKVVIDTNNLRRFLARRRWQRCGQAVRAMKRMSGLMLKKRSSQSPSSLPQQEHDISLPSSSGKMSEDVCTSSTFVNKIVQDSPKYNQNC